jgi:programmed cell death 6-interacting protein
MAKVEAKKAMDAARKTGVSRAVQDDIKVSFTVAWDSFHLLKTCCQFAFQSLYETLETSYKRAERDNDLIYHQVVPSVSSVLPIQELKDVVLSTVPLGLKDPQIVIKEGEAILGELCGWGVRVAIGKLQPSTISQSDLDPLFAFADIYKERKIDWVQLEIVDRAKQLNSASTS